MDEKLQKSCAEGHQLIFFAWTLECPLCESRRRHAADAEEQDKTRAILELKIIQLEGALDAATNRVFFTTS